MDKAIRTASHISFIVGFLCIVGAFISHLISIEIYIEGFIFGVCLILLGIALLAIVGPTKPSANDQPITPTHSPAIDQNHTKTVFEPPKPASVEAKTTASTTTKPSKHKKSCSLQDTIDNTIIPQTDADLQAFYDDHLLLSEFYTKVVGVTYNNDDGSSRQCILSKCRVGDPVMFHPYSFRGDPAFAVYTEHGQIGNLSADLAYNLENEYAYDVILAGAISEVTGGSKGAYWGCNLLIKVFADDAIEHTDLVSDAQPQVPEAKQQLISSEQIVTEESAIEAIVPPVNPATPDNVPLPDVDTTDATSIDNSSIDQETDMFDCIRDPQIMSHYIVLDIETTGFSRDNDRIIEIAAIHYVFGEEVKRFHTYINPQMPIPKHITSLTGIRQADVDTAPLLDDIADDFREFIKVYPLVGHNIIAFDLPFLVSNMDLNEDRLVIDTLEMSRITFPLLPSHKLSNLNFWFELNNSPSHRADADAAATNALLWACLYPEKYDPLYRKAIRNGLPKADHAHKATPRHFPEKIIISEVKSNPNQGVISGPLLGKRIVFTGELSISRKAAMQMAVDAGALLRSGVSGKTDILVVGKLDLSVVGTDGMSYKQEKAQELNNAGKAHIQILSEREFLSLIQNSEATA